MTALPREFYERPVLEVAPDLVGCVLRHGETAGRIVETEAYHQSEPACHAFAGLTPRTEVLFGPAGRAYVYRSYGIHSLINAVTDAEGEGAAVLIRALDPLDGIDLMRARRRLDRPQDLCSGPGKLTQALAIGLELNGSGLDGPVSIEPPPSGRPPPLVTAGPRIGITRAVELPWRFCDAASSCISRPRPPALRAAGRRAA